jgi:PAS domain S-box-containing protein
MMGWKSGDPVMVVRSKSAKTKKAAKRKSVKPAAARKLPVNRKIQQLETKLKRALAAKKKAEQKARRMNSYLANLLNHIPGSVYWKDRDSVYLGCNKFMARVSGLKSPEDVVGKTDHDLSWHKSADILQELDRAVIENGEERTVEEVGQLADGKRATYLSTKVPLRDEKDNIIGVLGVSADITERKQLEAKLVKLKTEADRQKKLVQRYLDTIIANLPCHIYWKDLNGAFLGCNDRQAQSAGFEKGADLIGKTDYEMPWKEQADFLREIDSEIIRTGEKKTVEELSVLVDGTLATFLTHKVPLHDDEDNIIGVLGVSVDITDRQKMEQDLKEAKEKAEEANRAKSIFLSSMAHDLRTPMNGMWGMSQVIHQRLKQYIDNDPELSGYFEGITKAKQALERLIDDILGYVKLEAGKVEIVSESFNFRQIIQDVVLMVTHQANQKGVKLLVDYPDHIPRHLISDPHCVRRILINLVNNAVKFTDQGHVWIGVECLENNGKEATLKLSVEDTGIGIPPDKLDYVFERFGRVESSETSKYQGTGLGLAIVKELAAKLGGTADVKSELHKGATFSCTIPFVLQSVVAKPSPWQRRYANVPILVVDEDARRGRRILENLGTSNGHTVIGKETLSALLAAQNEGKPYALVVIDDEVNEDAKTLARSINDHVELSKPLLLLLAKPGKLADMEAAKAAGFFGQLIKPVQPTELTSGVIRFWQEWQTKQSPLALDQLKQAAPKVLLIEDDMVSQRFASVMLQNLGCHVDIAGSGKEALAAFNKDHDIIFTDLGLPDMHGDEFAKAIRLREASDYPTPIIALTGHIEEADKLKCLTAGMNGFLGKPVEQDQLQAMLVRWVLGVGAEKEDLLHTSS